MRNPLAMLAALAPIACWSAEQPSVAPSVRTTAWQVESHIDEWERFLTAADHGDRWPAFNQEVLMPNRHVLDELLTRLGIRDPHSFFEDKVATLDLAVARTTLTRMKERDIRGLVEQALADTIEALPQSSALPGRIQLWMLFGFFDGFGTLLEERPTALLDCSVLAGKASQQIKVLTAHETHHAIRLYLLGSWIRKGGSLLDANVGASLAAEGLAVAFSEKLYPGRPIETYIPYYSLHPDRLPRVVEQEAEIRRVLLGHLDQTLSHPAVRGYFYGAGHDDQSSPTRNAAYYVGYRIVRDMMDRGFGIDDMSGWSAKELFRRYRNR